MTDLKHETEDLRPKYVVYFAAGLVAIGLGVFGLAWWMLRQFEGGQASHVNPVPPPNVQTSVPQPQLQINPDGDLENLRRQETEILSTYRWIDREKGIARIPIDRAMQLFSERQKK